MGFGITTDTQSEERVNKFMDATIETGRFITGLSVNEEDPNKVYFHVEMEDAEGRTVSKRYFEPSIDGMYVKDASELSKSQNKFSSLIANLARKFIPDYVLEAPEGTSFAAFCKKVIADIGDKYKGVDLRTKVVLNSSNFPTLPGAAPIWELATVPENESKLKYERYDKTEPSVAEADKDKETVKSTDPGW